MLSAVREEVARVEQGHERLLEEQKHKYDLGLRLHACTHAHMHTRSSDAVMICLRFTLPS